MKEELKKIVDSFKKYKVLVIGDAILDTYVKGTSDRLSREAPVPVINVSEYEHDCGGAANTAINVATLGAETYFLSTVGKDDSARELTNVLEKHKVRTEFMLRDENRVTLSKKRITASSNILLRVDEGTTGDLEESVRQELCAKLKKLYSKVDAIILSDYGYGVINDEIIALLGELKAKSPKIIIADSKNLSRFKSIAPTAVKPNYSESLGLLNLNKVHDLERIDQIAGNHENLLEVTGAGCVAATLDADGALVLQKGKPVHRIVTTPQDNKKSIGAGDTFISALCLAFCAGSEATKAAEIASAAAAVVLQKDGTVFCDCNELKAYFNDNPKHISSKKELIQKVSSLRKEGKKIVFTNGCFDILHRGHVSLLNKAKSLGDVLIVGLNGDKSIRRLKGKERPINALEDRITVLAGLQNVNYLVSFEEDSPVDLLKNIQPDVFVKGGDYTEESLPEAQLVKDLGGEVKIIPFVDDKSTTTIIEKIRDTAKRDNSERIRKKKYARESGMDQV